MTRVVEIRSGSYRDSVGLMQVSSRLRELAGVDAALVAMATPLNLDVLAGMGFPAPDGAAPQDMVVAIDAVDEEALVRARAALEAELSAVPRAPGGDVDVPPPTIATALRRRPARLVLVSTPGAVAAIDAMDALDAGVDVMVFSDNVAVEDEVALKEIARSRGLLVLGPDCGTAVVDGVGLGFANVVRPGPVGIVAASGTGAQHLLALLDSAGIGVTHCLGVGGRDLSAAVAARSTLTALERLDADDTVELVVLVSKPPDDDVARSVAGYVATMSTPVVLGYLGAGRPDLTATAREVVRRLGADWPTPRRWGFAKPPPRPGHLRGLFTGGTLCDEAMLIAADVLGPVASNIPLPGAARLGPDLGADGHAFIDFGDDRLTVGRPHPMIDPSLRQQRLRAELADPACAVVLLDVVLGHGAHPDPATDLAAAVDGATTTVVVTLVGTRDDQQGLEAQAERLVDAGALVHASNAAATREALSMLEGRPS